jgi:hypothetical protein
MVLLKYVAAVRLLGGYKKRVWKKRGTAMLCVKYADKCLITNVQKCVSRALTSKIRALRAYDSVIQQG